MTAAGTEVGLAAVCVAVGGTTLVAAGLTAVAVGDGCGVEVEGTGDDVADGVAEGPASATCTGEADGVSTGSRPASSPQAKDRPINPARKQNAISHRCLNSHVLSAVERSSRSSNCTYAGGSGVLRPPSECRVLAPACLRWRPGIGPHPRL